MIIVVWTVLVPLMLLAYAKSIKQTSIPSQSVVIRPTIAIVSPSPTPTDVPLPYTWKKVVVTSVPLRKPTVTPKGSPTPTPFASTTMKAIGTYNQYGSSITVTLAFPSTGGTVTGGISGSCTGVVVGNYTGGVVGTLTGSSPVVCYQSGQKKEGNITFNSSVDLTKTSLTLNAQAQIGGLTQTVIAPLNLSK